MSDKRSERRIRNNKIRRQREMRKNIILTIMTICLVITFSLSLSSFLSNAKEDSGKTCYKCYKSITIANDDTLWSIAQEYMDDEHYDSVNDYIKEVKKINVLSTNDITYGAHLIVPYYAYGD
ncbi:MAG: LysM peptidoglycan-binding domain-containing protein [Butyrivibrio sp.]|nr:LysM peptidoglycan-binding domain-containing protein [Butyrivibrio sp.]